MCAAKRGTEFGFFLEQSYFTAKKSALTGV
jgi:hypothetical protein